MERHPLDPVALVAGVLTVVGGVVALLHQTGAFGLDVGSTGLIACVALGVGGAALVALTNRSGAPARTEPGEEPAP